MNEDVHGGWAKALDLRPGSGEPGWAIVTPDGLAAWTHHGRIGPHDLATALDTHLRRAPDLRPKPHRHAIEPGMRIGAMVVHPDYGDLVDMLEPDCPPAPLFLPNMDKTVLAFVQHGGASGAHLRRLAAQLAPGEEDARGSAPTLVVVVDGAAAHQADAFRREMGLDAVTIPDPKGQITDRFGIDVWPTTLTVDRRGVVTDVEIGVAARRPAAGLRTGQEAPPGRAAV